MQEPPDDTAAAAGAPFSGCLCVTRAATSGRAIPQMPVWAVI
jgi:hypothetical protein